MHKVKSKNQLDEIIDEAHEEETGNAFSKDGTECDHVVVDESTDKEEKKNYASIYHEKKATKNPNGYTHSEVLLMIKAGTLIPGSPPKERNCRSAAWKNGMHFLYTKETANESRKEAINWFYCSKCNWIYNGVLGNGTNAVGQHYKKHFIDPPYMFNRQQLAKLLANATAFGSTNGSTNESMFIDILPKGDEWSEEFWSDIYPKEVQAVETNEEKLDFADDSVAETPTKQEQHVEMNEVAKKSVKRPRQVMESVDPVELAETSTKRRKKRTKKNVTSPKLHSEENQRTNKKKTNISDGSLSISSSSQARAKKSLGPFFKMNYVSSPMLNKEWNDELSEGKSDDDVAPPSSSTEDGIGNDDGRKFGGKKNGRSRDRKMSTPIQKYRLKLRKRDMKTYTK